MRDAIPANAPTTFSIDARMGLSIHEFCHAVGISPALYYKLQRNNEGPRTTKIGNRTVITPEEARDWLRKLTERGADGQ
jgi:predicted DNA-binding transcriptional regulator AlpA